jgi:cytoskeleton protein RodZ
MQTIGERLEEARKRKGISIREASESTKIRSDYLHRFESNSFDLNLPEIYVRGFLRAYAQYLKLPADKIVTDYRGLGLGEAKRRPAGDARESYGRIEVPEAASAPEPAATAGAPASSRLHPPQRHAPAQPPHAPSEPTSSVAATAGVDRAQLIKIGVVVACAVVALLILFLAIRAVLAPSASDAPRAGTTLPAPPATEIVTLVAIDNVSVKVVQEADGTVLFQGDLARGETRTIGKQGRILVTASAGRNLQLEKGGVRYRLGFDGLGRSSMD